MTLQEHKAHILVVLLVAIAFASGASRMVFNGLIDTHFRWFKGESTGSIVLIAIDPQSIKAMGIWPWPRSLHAQLIDKLVDAGASEIVLDIDFSSHQTEEADARFLESLGKAGGSIVLPTFSQAVRNVEGRSLTVTTKPLQEFRAKSWSAMANVWTAKDGLVRSYSYGETVDGEFIPSIGALLAGIYRPTLDSFYIDYGIRPETVPVVSYIDVLEGRVPKERLTGKKVVVGATAVELGDRFNVPNGQIISGPLLQIVAAESLIQDRALSTTSAVTTIFGLLVLALLAQFAWRRRSGPVRLATVLVTSVTIEIFAAIAHARWSIILDTSLWQLALAAYLIAIALDEINFRGILVRIAESRFSNIAMSVGDGLVCTDHRGIITFSNPAAAAIFGYPREEMLGRPIEDLLASRATRSLIGAEYPSISDGAATTERIVELQGLRRSGEVFSLEASVSDWGSGEALHHGFVLRDISDRKKKEERIRFLAEHDVLTGLVNRSKLSDDLAPMISAKPDAQGEVALIMLGIDHFKEINDTLGQDRGDQIIRALATMLSQRFSKQATVARTNGDEFAIALPLTATSLSAALMIEAVVREFSKVSVQLDDRTVTITASLGSAVYPNDAETVTGLMANAALALQEAKTCGAGRHVAYRTEIRQTIEAARRLEHELKLAFERNEFELFYQPQFDLATRKLTGAEALIRWHHPTKGLLAPGLFVPVLDSMPLSKLVGRWVIETACAQTARWEKQGHALTVGINLSPTLFSTDTLPQVVATALAKSGAPPASIELEVTENIFFKDHDTAAAALKDIRKSGVTIAFDDFGTGYASLTHLKRFPIDRLKIDRTFVRDLLSNKDDRAIVRTIIDLSKLLEMKVIAEGIEDAATADALAAMGCPQAQGYFFGRPVPVSEFEERHLSDYIAPSELTDRSICPAA